MDKHEEFKRKIGRSLSQMEAKISYLHDGMKGLNEAFKEFVGEITDFMSYTAENYSDHEKRIKNLEKKVS